MRYNTADLAAFRAVINRLKARGRRLSKMTDLKRTIEKRAEAVVNMNGHMERIISTRFRLQSTRTTGGRPWAARKERGDGHPILNDTGALLNAAIKAVRGTYRMNHRLIIWNLVDVGIEYSVYHQEGNPDRNLPRRAFFYLPSKAELRPADREAITTVRRELRRRLG